jgi:thiamine-phosphate pyrophosphorylase
LLLYYITARSAFPGDESSRRRRLLDKIAEAASCGVDYIQLREKDLSAHDLEALAGEAMQVIRDQSHAAADGELRTALLISSRSDVALAIGAAGIHLPAHDISPREVKAAWRLRTAICSAGVSPGVSSKSGQAVTPEILSPEPVVAVSCHSAEEVAEAASGHATLAVFGPVFEKQNAPGTAAGLEGLTKACRAKLPVLALGGVTLRNAQSCLEAGASGIAAIRLFQENNIATIVRQLRG